MLFVVLTIAAFLVLLLAKVTILGLVCCPLFVVDAPMSCFLTNLFVFWFVVIGWHLLPFFVLLLQALVCIVLVILVIVSCILTCIGSLFSLVLSLMSISVELGGQLGRELKRFVSSVVNSEASGDGSVGRPEGDVC